MASIEPFNTLVKMTARAFYDDLTAKGENQAKSGRSDNRGIAVIILDALTRRQWVREEDLAKDLKIHTKQLRRTLRFFEEERLITRDHRKETAKGAKIYNAAVAAVGDVQTGREGDDKLKMHTHSYCCLDYSQIYDMVRYRIQRMKKKLKDEVESKNTVQEYTCPNCNRRYTALDALRLISLHDEYFHCESCDGILVAESDKLAAQDVGDGDDNARRRRQEKLKDLIGKLEKQLSPLTKQLDRVKDLPPPEFGSLHAWELRANAAGRANGDFDHDSKSSQGLGFGGTPMPYVGETKIEVAFSGVDDKGDVKPVDSSEPSKRFPQWMVMQGMNLTPAQLGVTKPETKMGDSSSALEPSDDKKPTTLNDGTKNYEDAYLEAYYAALLQRQREQKDTIKKEQEPNEDYNTSTERQPGSKSKRDDDYEEDDVEWEGGLPTGNTSEPKLDLNEEAEASEDGEDEIDWEEG